MSKQRGENPNNVVNKFNVPLNYVQYLTQYCDVLKEADLYIGHLFKSYRIRKSDRSGYYTAQPMGVHMLAKTGVQVAEFLGLENPQSFTGHSFRRSSATNMAEAGASSTDMKTHVNWKNEGTALKYINNSTAHKIRIGQMMEPSKSTSSSSVTTSCIHTDSKNVSKVVNFGKLFQYHT